MKNKGIYIKPCAKALKIETGTLLAGSGGISGEIPDMPWGEKSDDNDSDADDVEIENKNLSPYSFYNSNGL